MEQIINTLQTRFLDIILALWQHLQLSIISLLIACLIAIPLAILLKNKTRIAEIVLNITSVLQTIPSLAILGLLIPLVGIGSTPAIITLIIYALLPIFQNTYLGLKSIDPSLIEASDAFGMSASYKLKKVEIPLALPMIISGIRIALVMIVGTATLAALIGAGGLGTFILLGIDRNDQALIIIGATLAALLALIISYAVKKLEQVSYQRAFTIISIFLVLFAGISAYTNYTQNQKKEVIIAGKLGSEPEIIINMYKYLIEDNSDEYKVNLKPNFGKTSFLFSALENNEIDIYPEFSGTVLDSLVKGANKSLKDRKAVYQEARNLLAKQYKMEYLEPMAFENTYALAVKKAFATDHKLTNISDLKKIENQLHGGFTLEFIDRDDCFKAIQKGYNIDFKTSGMEPSLRYQAINNNQVNIIDAYSTDSELRQYNLVVLKDDKKVFPAYQGAPLAKQQFFIDNPTIKNALDKLKNKISEEQMQEMNYQVNVQKQKPQSVAYDYLVKNKLIKGVN